MLKVLDLFSGIGGFSLGLERTGGFKTIAFCEIDNYCQRVLHKHWPSVYIHSDIRTLTARHFDGYERPDVITGGFPCQDISYAGKRAGIGGARSGLWSEYARIVGELRPRIVAVENVSALLNGGIGRVLGDLAALGYDAEWDCIPACAIGAPHRRDRIWILAYPMRSGRSSESREQQEVGPGFPDSGCSGDVAHSNRPRLEGLREERKVSRRKAANRYFRQGCLGPEHKSEWWAVEPSVGRVANGIPNRVDRLRGLGNAIVPQIAEWIGYRILEAENVNR